MTRAQPNSILIPFFYRLSFLKQPLTSPSDITPKHHSQTSLPDITPGLTTRRKFPLKNLILWVDPLLRQDAGHFRVVPSASVSHRPQSSSSSACAGEPFPAFSVHLRKREGRGKPGSCPAGVSCRGCLSPSPAPPAQVNPFRHFRLTCGKGRTDRMACMRQSLEGAPLPRWKVVTVWAYRRHLPETESWLYAL